MMDPLWSETCWSTFKYFIILIVSTYYILCISWIIQCLTIIDARCKHEDYTTWILKTYSSTNQPHAPAPTLNVIAVLRLASVSSWARDHPRPREKPVSGGSSSSRLAVPHFFLFLCLFPFFPTWEYLQQTLDFLTRARKPVALAGPIWNSPLPSGHFSCAGSWCVIHIYTLMWSEPADLVYW